MNKKRILAPLTLAPAVIEQAAADNPHIELEYTDGVCPDGADK